MRGSGSLPAAAFSRPTPIGPTAGFLFCRSYPFPREASLSPGDGSSLYRDGPTVVVVTTIQVVALDCRLLWR